MGCGSSKNAAPVADTKLAEPRRFDHVQSFHFTEEQDRQDLPKQTASKPTNPLGGLYLAQEATEEEKQAAIDRSLQLHGPAAPVVLAKNVQDVHANSQRKHYFPDTPASWQIDEAQDKTSAPPVSRESMFPAVHGARSTSSHREPAAPSLKLPAIYGGKQRPTTPWALESGTLEPVPAAILALERKNQLNTAVPNA